MKCFYDLGTRLKSSVYSALYKLRLRKILTDATGLLKGSESSCIKGITDSKGSTGAKEKKRTC